MHVVIFEGSQWAEFAPFTLTRPVFLLQSGAGTLLDKQLRATEPTRVTFWVRDEMAEFTRSSVVPTLNIPATVNTPLDDEPALIFAARTLHFSSFEKQNDECVVEEDGLIKLAYARRPGLNHDDVLNRTDAWMSLKQLPRTMPQTRFPRHWGDLVAWNEESLLTDSIHWNDPAPAGGSQVQPEDIHAKPGVKIQPGTVLDASSGPILLDEGCVIGANCVIEGPCYIGKKTRISPLSVIKAGTSLGPQCRVGGEISNSIFIGHANKVHDGYMGDSYVGEWVNCGAGTTVSNLKSTYGEIRLTMGTRSLESGRIFLGAGLGDHAKLATGTLLSSGSYVGVSSMLATTKRAPKFTPSFRFITDDADEAMPVDKAAVVASRMEARRSVNFGELDQAILEYALNIAPTIEV
ncbi:MAG: putative sugar nucleotidyl transferase [Tepidisphaeraceae bacterium]